MGNDGGSELSSLRKPKQREYSPMMRFTERSSKRRHDIDSEW